MNWELLVQRLNGDSRDLPGSRAQQEMAPQCRAILSEEETSHFKNCAVLLLLYPLGENVEIVLMERPSNSGWHSDQLCFPGGKVEPIDKTLKDTALRESWEELGIRSDAVRILGSLSAINIPISKYIIHPFVGYTEKRPSFVINKSEVKTIYEINLHLLVKHTTMPIPYFSVYDKKLWGASAMIFNEFLEIISTLNS